MLIGPCLKHTNAHYTVPACFGVCGLWHTCLCATQTNPSGSAALPPLYLPLRLTGVFTVFQTTKYFSGNQTEDVGFLVSIFSPLTSVLVVPALVTSCSLKIQRETSSTSSSDLRLWEENRCTRLRRVFSQQSFCPPLHLRYVWFDFPIQFGFLSSFLSFLPPLLKKQDFCCLAAVASTHTCADTPQSHTHLGSTSTPQSHAFVSVGYSE